MKSQIFDVYLEEAQRLNILIDQGKEDVNSLLELIDQQLLEASGQDAFENFFRAERAFFQGQYNLALKLYSKASTVPHFLFYCHRTTAYVFKKIGRVKEALEFAEKALVLIPSDYSTLKILADLLIQADNIPRAKEVQNRLDLVRQESSYSTSDDDYLEMDLTDVDEILSRKIHEKEEEEFGGYEPIGLAESELDELENLFDDREPSYEYESTHLDDELSSFEEEEFEAPAPVMSFDGEDALERKVAAFEERQADLMQQYIQRAKSRKTAQRDALLLLNGWEQNERSDFSVKGPNAQASAKHLPEFLMPESYRKSSGGVFIRWNGKGIVVNPGLHFLDNFHKQGLYVTDIDAVIITRNSIEAYADLRGIYELNQQHNKVTKDVHVVNYLLSQDSFPSLSSWLTPRFKQERGTVRALSLFVDSPSKETLHLFDGVDLHYFPGLPESAEEKVDTTNLGIRLDLSSKEGKKSRSVAFLSNVPWSKHTGAHIKGCDVVIAGFGNTGGWDLNKIKYNSETLGFHGVSSLIEAAQPRLVLCQEFSGREGDIRMEVIKKLQRENSQSSVVLPGDAGLYLGLDSLSIRCSVSRSEVTPAKVHVAKTAESFGALSYLAPQCVL